MATSRATAGDPTRLWTPKETAQRLGMGESTIRAYIRAGNLPALRIGPPPAGEDRRPVRVRDTDLARFIDWLETEGGGAA